MLSALFVSTFGQGRPLMCLHGVESHGVRFVGMGSRLGGVRVVAPDLRGHGRSPMVGAWTLDEQMADLLPILADLGPETVLLGHSYGGLLAWELAARAPAALAKLILVDPAINVTPEFARGKRDEETGVGLNWSDASEAFAALSVDRPKDAMWSVALDVAVGIGAGPDGQLRPLLAREAVVAAWSQMQAPLSESAWRGPMLLLEAGQENGAFISAQVAAGLRSQLGDALQHVVLDATHAIPSTYPGLLAQQVELFLSRSGRSQ